MTTWQKLSIYTSEGSRAGTRPLHTALIATALEQGIYSAIAFRAMEGFGPQMAIPTANGLALETDLPIVVQILDQPDTINSFLASQKDLFHGCIIMVEDVEVFWSP